MPAKDRIFISYAHGDPGHFIDELQEQVRIACRGLKDFEVWTDDRIELSRDWIGKSNWPWTVPPARS